MSKLALAVTLGALTAAAFVYALYLLVFRRPLPDVRDAAGFRRRFLLATLLFVGLIAVGCRRETEGAAVMCYRQPPPPETPAPDAPERSAKAALGAVWRTLDPARGEEFSSVLHVAIQKGAVERQSWVLLNTAFRELAYHKQRTRGDGPMAKCYDMAFVGIVQMEARENALKRVELLAKAREAGQIDADTQARAEAALARDLNVLQSIQDRRDGSTTTDWQQMLQAYRDGKTTPSAAARSAAETIVDLEAPPPNDAATTK